MYINVLISYIIYISISSQYTWYNDLIIVNSFMNLKAVIVYKAIYDHHLDLMLD